MSRRTTVADFDAAPESERGAAIEHQVRLALVVPVQRGSSLLGLISIDEPGERWEFSARDVEVVEGVAVQMAVAVENARLYALQRDIATTLQEHLIHRLPEVTGVDLGRVSLPAYAPELIGGDFSSVIALDDRRVAALIGDVSGKGIKAAGLTETVSTAAASFAMIDPTPAFVLGKTADLLLQRGEHGHFVTALWLVLDTATGEVRYAGAGHPAPVVIQGGSASCLPIEPGLPLGTMPWDYATGRATLAEGDSLVLYTDGVTEARSGDELFDEKRLLEVASHLRGISAQEAAERVRDAVSAFAGKLKDDLQILVIRRTTGASSPD